jgi:formylglycine-generating enzyme required for sulfatase activity
MKTVKFKLSQNVNLEMVEIPAGSFLMGSFDFETEKRENETPQHEVNLKSFYLGKFPVTQAQWFAVMNDLPKISKEFRGDDLPVVNVWLEKAIEFCAKLSDLTGERFRLPSEAEWEYACRAGTTTPFSFGETLTADLANFNGEQPFKETPKTEFRKCLTPVGAFPPNAFGLYDMHGNVWEWCADIWHENYINAPTDGNAWLTNGDQSYCVQRGGSWIDRASNCRSAFRVGDIAHNNDHIVGLRVCMTKN